MSAPMARDRRTTSDAEAIAEAVQRPTMKFVATKTAEQLDLQALHRVRERLVSQRTGVINQIRAFLLERGIAVRRWVFARFHLNGPKTSAEAVPVHTSGSGSDGVTVSPSLAFCCN